eukprot:SAG25_NODE_219_length_11644_cov_21.713729_11_plen_247_part_00
MGRGNSRRKKKKRDAKARRAVAVAMDQQEKENKEGTEPPPDTAMGGTGVATGLGQVNEDETKLPIGSGETELKQGGTEPPPDTALSGTGVATDLEKQTEEHGGNSSGEHLPVEGPVPEQPDEGHPLATTMNDELEEPTGGDTSLDFATLIHYHLRGWWCSGSVVWCCCCRRSATAHEIRCSSLRKLYLQVVQVAMRGRRRSSPLAGRLVRAGPLLACLLHDGLSCTTGCDAWLRRNTSGGSPSPHP